MKRKTILLIIVPVFTLFSLGGCNEEQARKRIVAFSNATQLTASNIDKSYGLLNEQYFNTQVQQLINDYEKNPSTANPREIKEFLNVQYYQARIDILNALAKYAKSLTDIMSDDQLNEFDEATKEFGEELKDLSSSDISKEYFKGYLNEKEAGILATAVNAMGHYFIEYKRHKVIKEIVSEMNQHVSDICSMLLKDHENVRSQLKASYSERLTDRNTFLVNNYTQLPMQYREKEVRFLAELVVQERQAIRMLDGVETSISTLKDAHEKLHLAFSSEPEELDDLDKIINLLSAEARRIRSFYKSIEE